MTVIALQALGLGDFLTTLPALRALRRHFASDEIIWAGNPNFLSLIEPLVDDVVEVADIGSWTLLPRAEIGVNFHGSGPRSHELLAYTDHLIGHFHPTLAPHGPPWSPTKHMRDLWVDLLGAESIQANSADFLLPALSGSADHVVLHVGAKDKDRWWPIDRFAEVADALPHVVVTAGPGEEERAELVRGKQFRGSLIELAELVQTARLVISVDCGVAHLAYAYQRPSITLFGPAPATRWGPPDEVRHRVLGNTSQLESIQPEGPTSGHLVAVTSDEVIVQARELLNI